MLAFTIITLICVQLLAFIPAVLGELPITLFSEYTQLPFQGRYCISSIPASYRVSFGCDLATPAACLCTDPASSLKIATALRQCVGDQPTYYATISSVTQLWSSYCLTNAGVSAQDETILQDIPLYTQVTATVRYCASSVTSSFITRFGCNAYTKAPCLCGASVSSMMVNNAIGSCIGTYDPDDMQSASMLWSSYCDVNLRQPAVRSVGAPISVSATPTPSASNGASSSTARSTGLSLGPTSTQPSSSQSTSSSGQNGNSNQSSSKAIPWDAIGAVAGVAGVLVAIGIAWWTNRKSQWIQNAMGHLPFTQSHKPHPMYDGHPMHMRNPHGWA